jgi:nitrogen-specific signal transduction histidine kinase
MRRLADDWIRVLAALSQPAALIDVASTVIEAANPAFITLLDGAERELTGKPLAGFSAAADRPALIRALAAGVEAKSIEVRAELQGGPVTLALSLGATLDGGRRIVLARKIRPEERAQRQLLQYFRDANDSVGPRPAPRSRAHRQELS